MPELLSRLRLQHAGIRVQGTPRRLAVLVASLACQQPDAEDRVRGPPAKVRCPCTLTALGPTFALKSGTSPSLLLTDAALLTGIWAAQVSARPAAGAAVQSGLMAAQEPSSLSRCVSSLHAA